MLSTTIIKNLLVNKEFSSKVLSYLHPEYFDNRLESIIFQSISEFILQYNDSPSLDALKIIVSEKESSISRKEIQSKLDEIWNLENEKNLEWLIDSSEKFCKDAAIRNAILRAVDIIDGSDEKYTTEAIPDILKKAIATGFDTSIGHDYFDDYEDRLAFNTAEETRIPIGIGKIDKITKGGLKPKTLTIFYAGCVHPTTKVNVKINGKEKICYISEIEEFLERYSLVEVESPDGWVKVSEYIDKGEYEEYTLVMDNYETTSIKSNAEHLYETTLGWYSAEQISLIEDGIHILTKDGYKLGKVYHDEESLIPIVDITVDHPNHRYYTDGVSSHNTGVGKTFLMCGIAANVLKSGKNVLYLSMEMYSEAIGERIDANLLDLSIEDVYTDKTRFEKRINHVRQKTNGNLIIKEYPTGTASTADFSRLMDELKIKRNFIPDLVCVDYMSICKSRTVKNKADKYSYISAISEELRAMASIYNVAVVTGAQVNRGGYAADEIQMTDAAESFGGNFIADLILGLNVDKSDPDNDAMILTQFKNRYGPVDQMKRFRIRVDRSKMKVINDEEFDEHQENVIKEKARLKNKFLKK